MCVCVCVCVCVYSMYSRERRWVGGWTHARRLPVDTFARPIHTHPRRFSPNSLIRASLPSNATSHCRFKWQDLSGCFPQKALTHFACVAYTLYTLHSSFLILSERIFPPRCLHSPQPLPLGGSSFGNVDLFGSEGLGFGSPTYGMQEGSDMTGGGGRASLYNSDGGGRGAEWEAAERLMSFDLQLAHDDSGEPEAAAVSCHTCQMQSSNSMQKKVLVLKKML